MNRSHTADERGQSLSEVVLLLALLVLVAIGVLRVLGVSLGQVYCQIVSGLGIESQSCAVADNGPLISDNFNGDLSQWDFLTGNNWDQEDGRLCAGPNEHRALIQGSAGENFTVSVDATLDEGSWGYGVFFRSSVDESGRLQGYIFQYDPAYGSGEFLYRRWVNGYELSPFARARPESEFQWFGTQRHVEVEVRGDTMTTRIDGRTVLTAQDSAFDSGSAGLRTWISSRVCFDNFQVTSP